MPARRTVHVLAVVVAVCTVSGCQLKRPDIVPSRMIEPQFAAPEGPSGGVGATSSSPLQVRLLDTQARGHIGRRVLRQQPDGELVEDAIWRWSSAPDRYLDTALRLALTTRQDVRLVDSPSASSLAVTLLAWNLDAAGGSKLVGAIELQFIGPDRVVHAQVIRASEPVSETLPGNLSVAAGRLLQQLASEGVARVTRERTSPAISTAPWLVRRP